MIKILEINTGGLFYDGITLGTLTYYSNMDRTDIHADILAVSPLKQPAIKDEFNSIGIEVLELPYRNTKPVKYYRELKKLLKKEKYDIVRVCGSSAIMAIELLAAKQAKVKVRIAHSHNTKCDHRWLHTLLKPLFNHSYTHAFACGEEAGRWLFDKKDFTVIPNGKDISEYEFKPEWRSRIRQELQLDDSTLAFVHVGNFNEQKNHSYLIDIFKDIHMNVSHSKLFLFGTGHLADAIKAKVNELNLEGEVVFMGKRNNVNEYLSAMDIMLLPSLYEGLPNVIIEGQISGLPCIVSDKITKECAITDLVEFLPIDGSPQIWTDKIQSIDLTDRLKDKGRVLKMVNEAGYNIVDAAARLKKLFFEMVGR